jgi:hypothetical protein
VAQQPGAAALKANFFTNASPHSALQSYDDHRREIHRAGGATWT